MMFVKALGGLVSGPERARCLSILIFHRVLERPDPLFPEEPDAERFDRISRWLRASFHVMPLGEAVEALHEGRLPARALAITFDDGYADNQAIALPVLQRHGLHATFFVANAFLDGGRMWNDTIVEAVRGTRLERLDLSDQGLGVHSLTTMQDRRRTIDRLLPEVKYYSPAQREHTVERIAHACGAALPDDLMMTSAQLCALHKAGMAIGGHTVNHPILARLPDEVAQGEIEANKAQLEALVQAPLTLFAYPNGKPDQDYVGRHAVMVRAAGYHAAVSTAPGAARRDADLMQLPRFTPWDRGGLRFGLRLVGNMRRQGCLSA